MKGNGFLTMTAHEILKDAGVFADMGPAEILDHPAWTVPVEWSGEPAEIRSDGFVPAESVSFAVKLGADRCVLSIAATEAFPDLSRLIGVKDSVPGAVLQALAEKETGALLSALENATRMEVAIVGACEGAADARPFRIVRGGKDLVRFSLTLGPRVLEALGQLCRLDVAHPSIRERRIVCELEYAKIALGADEVAGLAPGDHILLPEMNEELPGRLVAAGRDDRDALRVVDAEPADVTAGAWLAAEGVLRRSRTERCRLRLVRGGRTLAEGSLAQLAGQPAFAIEKIGG